MKTFAWVNKFTVSATGEGIVRITFVDEVETGSDETVQAALAMTPENALLLAELLQRIIAEHAAKVAALPRPKAN